MKEKNQISQLPILQGIAPKTLETFYSMGKVVEYPKGTVLIRAREPDEYIYLLLSGKAMVYNLTHLGKRKILFVFGTGMMLNEHVFGTYSTPVYCETIEKSTVFAVPVHEFVKLMESDFTFTRNVFETQERKLWRLSHQLKNTMSSIYLERKLASKLWKMCRDFGVNKDGGMEIDVNLTVTFLADMLGVSRETTSRVCATLTENGLIRINKKRIFIPDPAKLSYFYKTGKIE